MQPDEAENGHCKSDHRNARSRRVGLDPRGTVARRRGYQWSAVRDERQYCMGADSLQFNVPVTEKSLSSARYLTAVLQSGTFEGHDKYKLRFNADHSLCVGGSTLESVIVEDCSSTGTVWAKDGTRWINVAETVSFGGGSDVYIAGYDRSGYSYQFKYLGQTGFHYQFAWK